MKIRKKIWPEYFEAVVSGRKSYDLRLNDFAVKDGAVLVLEEWDPNTSAYTGRVCEKEVTYVGRFRIDDLDWPREEVAEKGIQVISLK